MNYTVFRSIRNYKNYIFRGNVVQKLEFKIEPLWKIIKEVKTQITEIMEQQKLPTSQIEFSCIVASELMENAIKYGAEIPEASKVGFTFALEDGRINILVRNGIKSSEFLKDFQEIMSRIGKHSASDLYLKRLEEIIQNPAVQKSQLGLYRIASETGFQLSYTLNDRILEVRATRIL